MNRPVVFVLGVACGVAATLVWQADRVIVAPPTQAPAPSVVSVPVPVVPSPVVARVEDDDHEDEVEIALDDGRTDASSLHEALAAAAGDYEAVVAPGEGFDGGRAYELLGDDRFHDFAMSLSANSSPAAAQHFQALNERLLSLPSVQSGAAYVQNLACGERVCTASIVSGDKAAAHAAWLELRGAARAPRLPADRPAITRDGFGMTVARPVETANGQELRLVIVPDFEMRRPRRRGGG